MLDRLSCDESAFTPHGHRSAILGAKATENEPPFRPRRNVTVEVAVAAAFLMEPKRCHQNSSLRTPEGPACRS
jgi:hypothetical protein